MDDGWMDGKLHEKGPLIYVIITNLSSFNTSQNIIFQKSSYKNRPIINYLGAKIPLSYYTL
jgi:hypothetical protein